MKENWVLKASLFLSGQCISMLGSSMVQYAIMWYIVLDTKSGAVMSLYVLAGFLPHVFISPFAGVLADRFNRKTIIIAADSTIAVVTLVLAIVFLNGYKPTWLLLTAAFIRSCGGGIQSPAVSAVLPQIVPKDKLMKVGGINGSMNSLIYMLSPALGGLLLSALDIVGVFFVDVLTAGVAVLALVFIHIPDHERVNEKKSGGYLSDIKQGVSYVAKSPLIIWFFIYYALYCIFLTPITFLSPIYISRVFGSEVWMLTVQEMTYSAGAVLGGLALSKWGGFKNRALTLGYGALLFGAFTLLLPIAPNVYIYYVLSFSIGLSLPLSNTTLTVFLQENVKGDILGRVFSLVALIGAAASPISMCIFGPLADTTDIRLLFVICAAFLISLGSVFIIKSKSFK